MVQYVVFLDTPKYWYLAFLDTPKSALTFMIFYELLWFYNVIYIYISYINQPMVTLWLHVVSLHQYPSMTSHQIIPGFDRVNRSQGAIGSMQWEFLRPSHANQPLAATTRWKLGLRCKRERLFDIKQFLKMSKKLICSSFSLLSNLRICGILPKETVKTCKSNMWSWNVVSEHI